MKKSSVFKSILTATMSLAVFHTVYIVVCYVLLLLISLLGSIPLIGNFLNLLFKLRGDTPLLFSAIVGTVTGYFLLKLVAEAVVKNASTINQSYKIYGVIHILLYAISFVFNIINYDGTNGTNFIICIIQIITGIIIFNSKVDSTDT